jgi:hypothetical protein
VFVLNSVVMLQIKARSLSKMGVLHLERL